MKYIPVILLFLSPFFSSAQLAWRAKIIVYSLNNNNERFSDTVWFGCDMLGALGFQSGLDEKTSVLEQKVISIDQSTGDTLRTNIQSFNKNALTTFNFKCLRGIEYIVWDTLELFYAPTDSLFLISMNLIAPNSVSLDGVWHQSQIALYEAKPFFNFPCHFYYNDSILVMEGGSGMPFSIEVIFGDSTFYKHISVNKINGHSSDYIITQGEQMVRVISKKGKGNPFSVKVYLPDGSLIEQDYCESERYEFDWHYFSSGMYIIEINGEETTIIRKLLKY